MDAIVSTVRFRWQDQTASILLRGFTWHLSPSIIRPWLRGCVWRAVARTCRQSRRRSDGCTVHPSLRRRAFSPVVIPSAQNVKLNTDKSFVPGEVPSNVMVPQARAWRGGPASPRGEGTFVFVYVLSTGFGNGNRRHDAGLSGPSRRRVRWGRRSLLALCQ